MWRFGPSEMPSKIIAAAKQDGWEKSLYMLERNKADWVKGTGRFPLSILASPKNRLLDAGCGWGGVTFWVAPEFRHVYAIDVEMEGLQFIDIRASQDHHNNIITVMGSVDRLPFPDHFFDVVLLNGVLEWIGTFSEESLPEQLQLDALKEIKRVIQPEGTLYIAIENRYGLQYFIGYKEEHTGLRFVSLLPRKLANKYHRYRKGYSYRALTHSRPALRRMLERAGFGEADFFAAFPSYRNCRYALSSINAGAFRFLIGTLKGTNGSWVRRLAKVLLEISSHFSIMLKALLFFSPSWLVFASPTEKPVFKFTHNTPRLRLMNSKNRGIAITMNNRRANIFQTIGSVGKLDGKYSIPLNRIAREKIKRTNHLLNSFLESNSTLSKVIPNTTIIETSYGDIEHTRAADATPMSFIGADDLRLFCHFIASFSNINLLNDKLSENFEDYSIVNDFHRMAKRYKMERRIFKLLDRRQIIHGDLTVQNILIRNRRGKRDVMLIDFEHAKIGPGTFNWYDFLFRNCIVKGGCLPISSKTAIRRFQKFPGFQSADTLLRDLTIIFLQKCGVALDLHSQLTLLYFCYLTRDNIVSDPGFVKKEIIKMDLRV